MLLSLAEAQTHGYALVQRTRSRSGGLVDPGTGSFYAIVTKLSDDGLIAEADMRDADSRRRCYGVTPLGRSVLLAKADRRRHKSRPRANSGLRRTAAAEARDDALKLYSIKT